MKHSYFGRKLKRTKNERRHLFAGLARDLFLRGAIHTTTGRAKAVQPLVEKLITKAKSATNADRNQLAKVLADRETEKLVLSLARDQFAGRSSGYTRIIKLGSRRGDGAEQVLLQFVDQVEKTEVITPKSKPKVESKSVEPSKKITKTKVAKK